MDFGWTAVLLALISGYALGCIFTLSLAFRAFSKDVHRDECHTDEYSDGQSSRSAIDHKSVEMDAQALPGKKVVQLPVKAFTQVSSGSCASEGL